MDDSQILEILANSRAARLRWLAFGLLAALYIVGNLFMQFHLLWLTALLGVAAISNSILAAIAARLRSPASPDRLTGLLYARITIDLLLLFSAIRITGGIESPFLFLLIAYLFVIGLDAGPRVGLVASASAMLGLGLNAYLEFIHVLPHLLIGLPFETEYSNPLFIYLNLIFIAAVIYFGLANLRAVTEKLRAREANLSKTKEQLEQRVSELDALRAIGAQLTASLNLETVLQAIGQNALELVKANDAQIFLYDFSSDEFGRGVGVWADPQRHLELAPPRVNGLTRAAAQRQAPILISNIAGNPFFAEPKARDWNLASIGSFPLIKNARVVGVMNISFQQPHAFTAEEQSVLMSLADHAALAIDNASLYVQAERRTNELTALYETSHAAAQMIAPEKFFERALDATLQVLDARAAMIFVVEENRERVSLAAQRGLSFQSLEGLRAFAPIETTSLIGRVLASGEIQNANAERDSFSVAMPGLKEETFHALTAIPLKSKEISLGVLMIAPASTLSAQDISLVTTIAQQLAVALENTRLYHQARRRADELASLSEIGLAMTSTLEMREQLRLLHAQVNRVIHPDTFFVGLYDEPRNEIRIEFIIEEGWELRGLNLSAQGSGLTPWVIQKRRALRIDDLELERDKLPVPPRHETRPARSWLGIPLMIQNRVIGILSVQSFKPNAFSEADERFLSAVAQHAALALENARLFETAARRARELELLADIMRAITASLDIDDIFRKTVRGLADTFGYPSVGLYRWQNKELQLKAQAAYEHPEVEFKSGLAERAANSGQAALVREVRADTDLRAAVPGAIKEIAMPIRREKKVLGVLAIQVHGETALNDEDLAIISTVADHLGAAIANADLYQASLERERLATSLQRIAQAMTLTLDPNQILNALCRESLEFFGVHSAYIWQVEGETLVGVAAYAGNSEEFLKMRVPLSDSDLLGAQIIRERRALFLNHVALSEQPASLRKLFRIQSLIGAPLVIENEIVGALMLVDQHNPERFANSDLDRIILLASQAARALANARAYTQARNLARQ